MKYLLLFVLLPVLGVAQQTPAEKQAFANRDKYLFSTSPVQKRFEKTIPFSYEPNNQIVVPVIIKGKTYHFVFDTGATTVVSKEIAEELALPSLFKNILQDGAGVEREETFYNVSDMQIADIDFKNVAVVAGDMKKFADVLCVNIDGLLGTNVLRSCYWKVDYSNGQLTFSDREIKPSKDMYAVDFKENFSGTPLLELYMGKYRVNMFMDTGYTKVVSIPDSLYFRARKEHERPYVKGYGTTTVTLFENNPKEKYVGLLDSVYIFNKRHLLLNPIADIDHADTYLVGNAVFKGFGQMILDWKKHRLYLPEKTVDIKEAYPSFGFSPLFVNNQLVVTVVWEGTEAFKKGITVGSIITAVNGQDTVNITHETWCGLLDLFGNNKPPEIMISVQDKGGKITGYTLKRTELLK
ncbi:MAG: aspartyl protease family protein [Bacteroidia bacterium]